MIGDTWIPDPNNRCRRCVCQEGESPGEGVAICTDDQDCLAGVEGEFDLRYCKFGNFREGVIFAKLRICEVS